MDVLIDIPQTEVELNNNLSEKEQAVQNLTEIEALIEDKMKTFAQKVGGEYVPPTPDQLRNKFDATLSVSPHAFYHIDEGGIIWGPGGEMGHGGGNVTTFNETGLHGYILTTSKEKDPDKTTRIYRGCVLKPDQQQVASMARMKGISVQDLYGYREGRITLDQLVNKAEESFDKQYLNYSMSQIRGRAQKYGTDEFDEVRQLHTAFTPGATDIDLWVSAAQDPIKIYRSSTSVGNAYGDFIRSDGGMNCVLIIDAPTRDVEHFGNARSESGVFGELKPKWIKAIIPATGNQEQFLSTVKDAEAKILENEIR